MLKSHHSLTLISTMDGTSKERSNNVSSSHPLFSIAATSGLVVLLYVPRPVLSFLFSPAPITALLLLAGALLRFCSAPPTALRRGREQLSAEAPSSCEPKDHPGFHHKSLLCGETAEWVPRGAPLDVIYEEYEEGSPEYSRPPGYPRVAAAAMGLYYPDASDTESSDEGSDHDDYHLAFPERWDPPEKLCFRWWDDEEEAEEEDGMIEIKLEEENFIEIDISGRR